MKKVFMFSIAVLFVSMTNMANASTIVANKTTTHFLAAAPPTAVLNAFTSIFGNVPVSQWKLRSSGEWRAHFLKNGTPWEATFSANGTLVKSEPK